MIRRVAGVVLFQAGWIAAVAGAGFGRPGAGAAVATIVCLAIIALSQERGPALSIAAVAAVAGPPLDSLQVAAGLLSLQQPLVLGLWPPPWLVVLWPLFTATLPLGFRWLYGRPLLAASLGAIAGPASYWAGARLGAATLHPQVWPSLISIAIEWAVMLPALCWLARRFGPGAAGRGGPVVAAGT